MAIKQTTKEITVELLKEIQSQLRDHDLNWKEQLVKQVKGDDTIDRKFRKDIKNAKIYNVMNGIVRDPAWKLFIFTQATVLLEDYKKKLSEALK